MSRRFTLAVVLLLPGRILAVSPPDSCPRATLSLLHDGRFDEAQDSLATSKDSPSGAFLSAFVVYWRLLYDDRNPALVRSFEETLTRAAEIGERSEPGQPSADGGFLWGGYARLLLAQLRVTQKKPLLAAREARAGRQLLEQALQGDPSSIEPLFGLGTYNYYADRMSAIMKGFRFLFGLPGGDRERGLEQLETSARESSCFSLESRIILATIYGSRHERLYALASRQAARALEVEPDAVTALDAAARLELSLGDPIRARDHLARALARARAAPRTDPSVLAMLEYQHARVEFALFRPDRTAAILGEPLRSSATPARVRADADALSALAEQLLRAGPKRTSVPPEVWEAVLPALESEGPAALLDLSKKLPTEPVVALLLGRALLLEGRGPEALRWLRRADSSGELPDPWLGPARLLAGKAADLAGKRELALDFYRRALKAPPFLESEAARLHQRTPYRAQG